MPPTARRPIGLVLAALIVVACGSSVAGPTVPATQPPGSGAAQSSVAPSGSPVATASKGPATSQFALTGTAGLTGPVTAQTITCGRPSLAGPQIFFLGQAGATGPQIVIFVRPGFAEVRVATGSAATLRERDFSGTGVTNFDAAVGVRIDTALTETTAPGTATGDLGALTRISGSIDCGDQSPGSANIVVSGQTPYGQLDGALTSIKVECTGTGTAAYVSVAGLSMAGTTPVLVFATASTAMIQVVVETSTSASGYQGKGTGITTMVPGGATMAGDVAAQVTAPATPSPNLLHVAGSATCGTP